MAEIFKKKLADNFKKIAGDLDPSIKDSLSIGVMQNCFDLLRITYESFCWKKQNYT
jgi:hypothetical protein